MTIHPRLRSMGLLALVPAVTAGSEAWRTWSSDRAGSEVAALARRATSR